MKIKSEKSKKFKQETLNRMGSCRALMRIIAHENMRKADIPHPNRKKGDGRSFFSKCWREFV